MATFSLNLVPVMEVLLSGGRMKISELADKVFEMNPILFREGSLLRTIDAYSACLKIDGGSVVFDRSAESYTRFVYIYERAVQAAVHGAVPDMEKWQLYPFKTRDNSDSCYIGVPWSDIPDTDMFGQKEKRRYSTRCDYKKGSCTGRCGVSDGALAKVGVIKRPAE